MGELGRQSKSEYPAPAPVGLKPKKRSTVSWRAVTAKESDEGRSFLTKGRPCFYTSLFDYIYLTLPSRQTSSEVSLLLNAAIIFET